MRLTFETTIKGGFPVTVEARIDGPDPDVGIFGDSAEIVSIKVRRVSKGKVSYRNADWLKLTQADEEELCEKALDSVNH